jgi:hypothetical protein
MEYVAGISITQYCDKHRLPMKARLELFVQVCGAIQHAHQKGVIHRDIKPSNLLVTVQDGSPVPKVIDFGVAKATHQRLIEQTAFTRHGVLIGTPSYMSPEQAEMGRLTVDTTTDIYSLGVVLYELLISALPFDPDHLRRAGYAEIQRIIREMEPLPPSARLSSLHRRAEVALERRTPLTTLVRQLKGDLDWITLKAMEKDRTRRYASASELATDVSRYLKTEPVVARPPSLTYRAGKFLRKYRSPLIAVALTVIASTIVSTAVLTQSVMESAARRMIEEVEQVENSVLHSMAQAVSRNPAIPWTAAVVTDGGVRQTLESNVLWRSVLLGVAICDADGGLVLGSDRSMRECPTGPPITELASISVLSVVSGTSLKRNIDYVSARSLRVDNSNVGTIRVRLSRLGMSSDFNSALRRGLFLCIAQFLAVGLAAIVGSWLVFRRD